MEPDPPPLCVGAYTTPSASYTPLPPAPVHTQYFLAEGLQGVAHRPYSGPVACANAIEARADEVLSGNAATKLIVTEVLLKAYEVGLEYEFVYMGRTTMTAPDERKEGDTPLGP
ncbi:hypothetical protein HOY82DRAFT_614745 [Tuber indicum]|nr:hypothetical protein HOY82DRAFT_614745 [Tuber indicum]